ncbi:MAG: exported protein of unknown function [Candidatus Saccharibacteria bacterium]|nr:exported protein of unknown function [Candidatus Saccharibacteria bacterium]
MVKPKTKAVAGTKKRIYIIIAVVVAVLVLVVVVGARVIAHIQHTAQSVETIVPMSPTDVDARRDRIQAIYANLNLGTGYTLTSKNVFGAKKQYSYDKGRTFSSEKDFTHDANVDTTANELKQKIEAARFKYFDEPYPGSIQVQYHFKSAKGEYIRLTVSSKPVDDYVRSHHKTDDKFFGMDKNAGPSNVIIKVNLDDNNE